MANKEIKVAMKQRSDTAENWKKNNPILLEGEIGYDSTSKAIKIGNGKDNWNTLPYQPGAPGTGLGAEVFNYYIEDNYGSINKATGYASHAEGCGTTASGDISHAEGNRSVASGMVSHAEGNFTKASDEYSHAEGDGTVATGYASHAEGCGTTASGLQSHAEGYNTVASGSNSHTEGDNARAFGDASHAEGYNTVASCKGFKITASDSSTKTYTLNSVEGLTVNDVFSIYYKYNGDTGNDYAIYDNAGKITNIDTSNKVITVDKYIQSPYDMYLFILKKPFIGTYELNGKASHAEGENTLTFGNDSHAEGHGSIAFGYASHAEGCSTTAYDVYSHAEGENTIASGNSSHAEGKNTIASSYYSHAEGYQTEASGICVHAEGNSTVASGDASHAEGDSTTASGRYSHAEGNITVASGDASHAEGDSTTASGYASHAEGYHTQASGYASHVEGYGATASGTYSHAEGLSTHAKGDYSHTGGIYSKAVSNLSFAYGESTIAGSKCFKIKAFDDTNKKYTLDSVEGLAVDDVFCMQLINNYDNYGKITAIDTTNKTVTVDKYHAAETETGKTPSNTFRVPAKPEVGTSDFGSGAFAEGYNNIAAGLYSHAEGEDNVAVGKYAHVEGKNNTAVYGAHAEGRNNTASGQMSHVEGSGNIGTNYAVHVEGANNQAHAGNDHAEGENNYVMGGDAHGEGYHNEVLGKYSHAEGSNNKVYGESAHAEGSSNIAYSVSSHVGGNNSKVLNDYSFAHGNNAIAGVKGFRITASDASAKTYTLNSVEGLAVDDTFTIFASSYINYVNYGSITAIDTANNKITVNNYAEVPGSPNYIIIASKPNIGTALGGKPAFAEGEYVKAFGGASHAEGSRTIAYGYASHAEGEITHANAAYSHSEGNYTAALGKYSHAEGCRTKASGIASHTEGSETEAFGDYSHAEGEQTDAGCKGFKIIASDASAKTYTLDSVNGLHDGQYFGTWIQYIGDDSSISIEYGGKITDVDVTNKIVTVDKYKSVPPAGAPYIGYFLCMSYSCGTTVLNISHSHAEGHRTYAIGNASHTEGDNTCASGMYSHAEGNYTVALGKYSHAEGCRTKASGYGQHVQGINNILDKENKYVHIVGNGDSTGSPSNAHTLDWEGNAWFAGDIKIGGTSYDDAAAKTISDLFNKITELTERIEALESQNYVLYDETPPPTELSDDNLWKIASIKTGIGGRLGSDGNPALDCVKINVCGTDTKWLGEFDDIDAALYSKDTSTNLYTKVCDFQLTNDVNFDGTNMYCVPYKGATIGPLNRNVISNVYTDHPGALFGYINDSEDNTVFTEYDMNGTDNGNMEYYLYTSKKKSEYSSNFSLDGLQMTRIVSGDAATKTYTIIPMNIIENGGLDGDFKLLYKYDSNTGKFNFVSDLGQCTEWDDSGYYSGGSTISITYNNYIDISDGDYFFYLGYPNVLSIGGTTNLSLNYALIDNDYEIEALDSDISDISKARIKLYNITLTNCPNISKISSLNAIVKLSTFDPASNKLQTVVENCNVISCTISDDDKVMLDLSRSTTSDNKPLYSYLYNLKNFTLIEITDINNNDYYCWYRFKD